MPVQQIQDGVGVTTSRTFFPLRPVEMGRSRGVAGLSRITNGTSGATTQTALATTCDRVGPSGLTVNVTAAGGVVTAQAVNAAGTGYRIGDIVTLVGSTASVAPTFSITSLVG